MDGKIITTRFISSNQKFLHEQSPSDNTAVAKKDSYI